MVLCKRIQLQSTLPRILTSAFVFFRPLRVLNLFDDRYITVHSVGNLDIYRCGLCCDWNLNSEQLFTPFIRWDAINSSRSSSHHNSKYFFTDVSLLSLPSFKAISVLSKTLALMRFESFRSSLLTSFSVLVASHSLSGRKQYLLQESYT